MADTQILLPPQLYEDIFHHDPTQLPVPQPFPSHGDDVALVDHSEISDDATDMDGFFADLPPLLRGEPKDVVHSLINQRTVVEREVDCEKAFFVADLGEVWKQHQRWKASLPRVEPFYAVKCNPDPYVLRLLAALGTGFDCASYGEISTVLSLGVDPSRIIFANPCKAASFIRNAAQMGVNLMTFDNVDELHKIARIHPGAQLVVRILTDDTKSVCRLGVKFGAPLGSVRTLLQVAKSLALDVVGVSFHVGSGCYDVNAFSDAIERAYAAFNIGRDVGFRFTLLDIGGGFDAVTFEKAATVINHSLDQYFPIEDGVRIIAEPGRYYVASAFTLAANIIARRAAALSVPHALTSETNPSDEPSVMYYINDGVYGSFNCILFDHQVVHPHSLTIGHVFTDQLAYKPSKALCSVWGPTCDSIDCVKAKVELPSGLEVGDWLGFPDMGAYTICAASQFNGFQESSVHYCSGIGESSRAVRTALAQLVGLF